MTRLSDLSPYRSLSEDEICRIQAWVSLRDKRTILAAMGGDDSILSFIVQHAYSQTATFIRTHGLTAYDSAPDHAKLLDFIRDRTAPRATRDTAPSAPAGPAEDCQPTAPSIPSQPAQRDQVNPRGVRKQAGKVVNKEGRAAG